MLLSSNPPPVRRARGRSKSWGSDLHDLVSMARSESTPSMTTKVLISPPTRDISRKAFQLHSSTPALGSVRDHPAHHHSTHLLDVTEEKELNYGRDGGVVDGVVPPPPPPPLEKKKPIIEGAWDLQDVWKWYNELPWLAGMNYLPRTAVNFIEMWDDSTFDPAVIEEELRWAADKLGYNTLRTNLPMCLYEQDAAGLTARVNKFLRIAARCGFVVGELKSNVVIVVVVVALRMIVIVLTILTRLFLITQYKSLSAYGRL